MPLLSMPNSASLADIIASTAAATAAHHELQSYQSRQQRCFENQAINLPALNISGCHLLLPVCL
jgi:hypothetical protein